MDVAAFGRRFDYDRMAFETAPWWWRELLRLWRASGDGHGANGTALRLAVRKDTLNFYQRGQSVAQVGFGRAGPYARVHRKYCVQNHSTDGGDYVRWSAAESSLTAPNFLPSVEAWAGHADKKADPEKKFIEAVVANDPNVVDLEIGLPGLKVKEGGRKRRSLRIDLAVLEPDAGSGWAVKFWEVKLHDDSRLCSERTRDPEILRQMADYDQFLDPATSELVAEAYRKACKVKVALADQAAKAGNPISLSRAIRSVADDDTPLRVHPKAHLLIGPPKDARRNPAAWACHLERLQMALPGRVREMDVPERLSRA